MTDEMLTVGAIVTPHGLRGEVKVKTLTSETSYFEVGKRLYLSLKGEVIPLQIRSRKSVKQFVVLGFKEFDRIEDVEGLRGAKLLIPIDESAPLTEDEYFMHDLMDMEVVTESGDAIGRLTGIMETGANDVYIVRKEDGREVLIPAIKDCVRMIDLDERVITIHPMEGLDL